MAETFSPKVYFAVAAAAQKAVNKLIYTTSATKKEGPTKSQSGDLQVKDVIGVPLSKLVAREGLRVGEDGYV